MKTWRLPLLTTLALALLLAAAPAAPAQDTLTIASGAGYKQLVQALCQAFAAESGITPQEIYGNMGQVTAQAQESGVVDLVIGDKKFLDKTTLPFAGELLIGTGRLVLAVAHDVPLPGLDELATLNQDNAEALLVSDVVTRIAMPDSERAIYGRAATEFLTNIGLIETLEPKLLVVATVPQVSAYVVSGEVDLGFINLTDGLAIEPDVARIIRVDESLYEPIRIVAKSLADAPDSEALAAFEAFLATDQARAIAEAQGL